MKYFAAFLIAALVPVAAEADYGGDDLPPDLPERIIYVSEAGDARAVSGSSGAASIDYHERRQAPSLPGYALPECHAAAGVSVPGGSASLASEASYCKKIRAEMRARVAADAAFSQALVFERLEDADRQEAALARFDQYTTAADNLLNQVILEMDDEANGFRSAMSSVKRNAVCPVQRLIPIIGNAGC